jgi:hypothetical protein
MSGGALMITGAVVLVVCCLGPIGFCVFGGVLGNLTKPKADVTLTACRINGPGDATRSAEIGYTIKNTGKSQGNYRIKFVVTDDAGTQVGDGTAYAFDLAAGASKSAIERVYLDADGGTRCKVAGVE